MNFLIGAPHRMGFKKRRVGLLNTIKVEFRDDIPILKQNLDILKAANIEVTKEEIELDVPEKDIIAIKKLMTEHNLNDFYPLIATHPGASWEARYRCWPIEKYISLIRTLLKELAAKVIIIGSKGEIEVGERIFREIQDPAVVSLIGKTTITQMAAIIKLSHIFIGTDSGPLHLASATGIPFIGIFGPTSAVQVLSDITNGILLYKKLPCSPCYLHHPLFTPSCSKPNSPLCMGVISVDEVIEAVKKIINSTPIGRRSIYANRD